MEVVIDNATLRRHRSCKDVYSNPEWDVERQALVIKDWDVTLKQFYLATPEGIEKLRWHVHHKLVPMTVSEFNEIMKSREGPK